MHDALKCLPVRLIDGLYSDPAIAGVLRLSPVGRLFPFLSYPKTDIRTVPHVFRNKTQEVIASGLSKPVTRADYFQGVQGPQDHRRARRDTIHFLDCQTSETLLSRMTSLFGLYCPNRSTPATVGRSWSVEIVGVSRLPLTPCHRSTQRTTATEQQC
jgi:hypothetical protein